MRPAGFLPITSRFRLCPGFICNKGMLNLIQSVVEHGFRVLQHYSGMRIEQYLCLESGRKQNPFLGRSRAAFCFFLHPGRSVINHVPGEDRFVSTVVPLLDYAVFLHFSKRRGRTGCLKSGDIDREYISVDQRRLRFWPQFHEMAIADGANGVIQARQGILAGIGQEC